MAMAFAQQKALVATPAARACRLAPVKALPNAEKIQVAVASAALAVALTASPAFAGVTFENQPQVKKAFQTSGEPAAKREPAAKSEPSEKSEGAGFSLPSFSFGEGSSSDELGVQSLWPLGIVASGGAIFAFSKIDTGFANILNDLAVRDSLALGAGNESSLKAPGGYVAPFYETKDAVVTGGTKVMKKKVISFGKKK